MGFFARLFMHAGSSFAAFFFFFFFFLFLLPFGIFFKKKFFEICSLKKVRAEVASIF